MSMRPLRLFALSLFAFTLATASAFADAVNFDLTGPTIEVKVTRAGKELPIASTPNLAPGDKLWIRSDFPEGQQNKYLLIACFLRGSTNQPPDNWFIRIETWDKHVMQDGTVVTVPNDAQQALLFLAPITGGDFNTLRNAVKGRPGAFVRATQDLNAASYDRARYETYASTMQSIPSGDAKQVKEESDLLARSLSIKVNQDCFNKPQGQEMVCLTAGENAMVMDDGHSSLVAQWTSGPSADLIANTSATPAVGGGFYSAYVGAVVDVVRIMGSLHTAQFQYIPALAEAKGDSLNLRLNNPPSFHNPKSVLVVGLPSVQGVQLPPLHAVDPEKVMCLAKPELTLAVEGAPLIFSSNFGHDLVLQLNDPKDAQGSSLATLPLRPDAAKGGLVVEPPTDGSAHIVDVSLSGTVTGAWGFDPYTGPSFHLQGVPSSHWALAAADTGKLVVGRDENIELKGEGSACIDSVKATTADGKTIPATWTAGGADKPDQLTVKLALKGVAPGAVTLAVKQFGMQQPIKVAMQTYSDPPTPQQLELHAGDVQAVLKGKGLEAIDSIQVESLTFKPGDIVAGKAADNGEETLPLSLPTGTANTLKPGTHPTAKIHLKDGRTLDLPVTIGAARPHITLDGRNVQLLASNSPAQFLFGGKDDLPVNATMTFFLHAAAPGQFSRNEKIEVATTDGSLHTELTMENGALVLEDSHTLLVTLNPAKAFGGSAFGDLQYRAVGEEGAGDWAPLAKLIRVPALRDVRCPMQSTSSCTLTGDSLYLVDAISSDPTFTDTKRVVPVPPSFSGNTLSVPRPDGTLLYLKLRDEPDSINTASLPVLPSAQ